MVTTLSEKEPWGGVTACIALVGNIELRSVDPARTTLLQEVLETGKSVPTGWLPTAAQTCNPGSQTCSGGRELQR